MTFYKLRKLDYIRNSGLIATIIYNQKSVCLFDYADYWFDESHQTKFMPCFGENNVLVGFVPAVTGPCVHGGIALDND